MSIFSKLFTPPVKSNTFDMSYDMKMSLDMGTLIPIHCQEIVPGDRITMSTETLLRMSPLIAPVMHKVDVYQHYFFVPNRIIWPGWEDFITGKTPIPAAPYFSNEAITRSSLGDYLGLPLTVDLDKFSALPFAAYQAIYQEYYRDENLSAEISYKLSDGDNALLFGPFSTIRKRAWQHDYFTSALPWAQKGDPVNIPIGDFNDVTVTLKNSTSPGTVKTADGSNFTAGAISSTSLGGAYGTLNDATGENLQYDPNGTLQAETSELETTGTINDLRRAISLQSWLEKQARGGTRYIEQMLTIFGVRSSDARLNRPEYLGGSKQPMIISEVLQTSNSVEDGTPQGNMAGHGVSVGGGKQFSYSAEEHGYLIGIMSIMPRTAYQQGVPKHFSKFDRLDYYWPDFAHLGEQEIKNREIFYSHADIINGDNDKTFGYIPRYSEYRYHDNRVAGDFRDSLAYWHLGRIFATRPLLNQSFIECDPSTRIFAVEDIINYDSIYAHVYHRIRATRKMPKYAIPEIG